MSPEPLAAEAPSALDVAFVAVWGDVGPHAERQSSGKPDRSTSSDGELGSPSTSDGKTGAAEDDDDMASELVRDHGLLGERGELAGSHSRRAI